MDYPEDRRIHRIPTPRLGGLGVFFGFILAVLANMVLPDQIVVVLLTGILLLVIGIMDDSWELPAWTKLVTQLVASGIVISWGMVLTVFPDGPIGDTANVLLTVLWLVGITNAFNFMDGMDGLAAGLAVLIAFFLGFVAFQTNQVELGWLSIAIIGACLGFLPYNFRTGGPAMIFLGDGGSTFLGFTLASLAVMGFWSDQNPIVSLISPILIFWVLIYDMIYLTVDRVVTGKVRSIREWLDYVGRDHLHHRLARALESQRASVLMIFTLTICLGLGAMALRKTDAPEAIMLLAQASLIVIIITVLEYRGRLHYSKGSSQISSEPAEQTAKPMYLVK
ncbi:MAG: undecaprenyl-phosphate alpha-N-acetylglucosaminyl 1-phosphate transferase [Nitrospirales bacterium]|nr:MAG: undecaprenyl-phosphate alpha-N-acetylglucosaminyl 1-phosphate transferase [Nitrospirales bacterium]